MPELRRPIFIVGCGRSGTTLLCQLLRAPPEVCATNGYPDGEDHAGRNERGRGMIGVPPSVRTIHPAVLSHSCIRSSSACEGPPARVEVFGARP